MATRRRIPDAPPREGAARHAAPPRREPPCRAPMVGAPPSRTPMARVPLCDLPIQGVVGVALARALLAAAFAAMLAAASGPAAAQSAVIMGRLFASPQERAALDAQRNAASGGQAINGQPAAAPQNGQPGMAPPVAPAADTPPPAPLQLNGVVRRGDGKSTVWLNEQPQVDGANALQNQTLSVRLSSGRQVILKAGQSFNPTNETVQDDAGQ